MGETVVRFAETEAERDAVFRLRYEINVQELGWRLHHQDGRVWDAEDEHGRIIIVLDQDTIVGTSRLLWGGDAPFSDDYRRAFDLDRFVGVADLQKIIIMDRLIVRPAYRGTLAFFQVLQQIAEFAAGHQIKLVFLDCAPHLINLYRQLGLRTYAPTFDLKGVGLMVPLICILDDLDYLHQIKSPLLSFYGDGHQPDPAFTQAVLDLILGSEAPVESASTTTISEWLETYELLTQAEIEQASLFKNLSEEDMRKILKKSNLIRCKKGETLILEGRDDRSIFAILSGQVEVRRKGVLVATCFEGDVVGEISFLTQKRRTADVIARSEVVEVISLSDVNLKKLMRSDPKVAAQLMYNLAQIVSIKLMAK